jgi:hypothetical protein
MFLIYINDIGEKLISLSRLFADDTSFHFEFWERITSRCLWLVDKGIHLPLKENSMLSMLPVLEKNKISVFSGLNEPVSAGSSHVSNIHK